MTNHSDEEDHWFKKHEKELIEEAKERKKTEEEKKQKEAEEALKQLHYRHCPKCGHELEEFLSEGIALDKCPKCEGVWFDKGELEQLISREEEHHHFFGGLLKLFKK
jgi:ribosomal protein L37AE/L43A